MHDKDSAKSRNRKFARVHMLQTPRIDVLNRESGEVISLGINLPHLTELYDSKLWRAHVTIPHT